MSWEELGSSQAITFPSVQPFVCHGPFFKDPVCKSEVSGNHCFTRDTLACALTEHLVKLLVNCANIDKRLLI